MDQESGGIGGEIMKTSTVIAEGIVGSIEDLMKTNGDLNKIEHEVKGQFSIPGAVVRYTFEREVSNCAVLCVDCSGLCPTYEGIEIRVRVKNA